MKKSDRLVFFGTEDFSAASLERLIDDGWQFEAVITKPDFKKGRGQHLFSPRVKDIAQAAGFEVWQPDSIADIKERLRSLNPQMGVLVAYGKIIPNEIIAIFPKGILNLHPSLLPLYRGPSPIEAAILNGDKVTGVSLMKLSPQMDAGPVYAQDKVKLNGTEDRLSLYERLAQRGASFLAANLEAILEGEIVARAQDDAKATYTQLLTKADGLVDWRKPAETIEREIRAYLGYPKSRTSINGHEIIITKARPASSETDGALLKSCGEGYLEILELVGPSGRTMSGADFTRGHRG